MRVEEARRLGVFYEGDEGVGGSRSSPSPSCDDSADTSSHDGSAASNGPSSGTSSAGNQFSAGQQGGTGNYSFDVNVQQHLAQQQKIQQYMQQQAGQTGVYYPQPSYGMGGQYGTGNYGGFPMGGMGSIGSMQGTMGSMQGNMGSM